MKITKKMAWGLAAGLATAMALSACGGGGNDNAPVAATSVPDSASATSASFVAFILGLALGDETSEPLTFSAGFAVPPDDETGEPVLL